MTSGAVITGGFGYESGLLVTAGYSPRVGSALGDLIKTSTRIDAFNYTTSNSQFPYETIPTSLPYSTEKS